MIGYTEDSGSRVYRLYDEEAGQVVVSRDVIFDADKRAASNFGSDNNTNRETELESSIDLELGSALGPGVNNTVPQLEEPNEEDSAQPLTPIDPGSVPSGPGRW